MVLAGNNKESWFRGQKRKMANKLINQLGLPKSIANIFTARNIITAKDALSLTEFELMELLDVGMSEVTSAMAHISELVCPPCQTALLLMEQRVRNESLAGHLPTQLKGLDEALCGGIPFGVVTELVGPPGIGKTQFCLKLSLLASLPVNYGGLDGRVIYIDVESKFSSKRLIEIGTKSFPEIFHKKGMAQEMAGRILILRPTSLSEFAESLQRIKVSLLQQQVKLLIIDSMAALVLGEHDCGASRQQALGWHVSFIKSLAEFSRIPIVLTNQVRSHVGDESLMYSFQAQSRSTKGDIPVTFDSHLVAALGINWAHAVTIRLVLESKSGKRFIKLAKSPMSPPLAFPFHITSSGIVLLDNDGIEMKGPEISTIHCQGQNALFNLEMAGH
ncbi:putative ATP diphosphatase [Medicago truncatula]|uniref:Putative ATP diphosphatase n=1 Tax=Medicago truncatula TaxID=3880 RepID=A0A396JGN5_MEDTR|nr:DNA repair protein RAD51 homolog 2 isoform X1 [Medicago truncatula]XP_039686748.1 DNA repair protein RAD51 homolog 2 isoform X1 [Medicago truncatula]XP_039686749.1 DNA repair protein RAD51 homolog 2 isoform X1 [Medicago truncatula]XP_039686750.1 DNA repair protein RAD51 homolog 2 isoform X1 [Medicago truncatula]RHN75871.1 putative ATP diphosphatase [Medicago truncatula]